MEIEYAVVDVLDACSHLVDSFRKLRFLEFSGTLPWSVILNPRVIIS